MNKYEKIVSLINRLKELHTELPLLVDEDRYNCEMEIESIEQQIEELEKGNNNE